MRSFVSAILALLALSNVARALTIETVPVSHVIPGTGTYRVDYSYRIGTYEVTNAQYAEFLNVKAKSDAYGLYNPEMGSAAQGGISRSGGVGSYSYATKPDMANKPVNFVSWFDAARFVNWMTNGQGTGNTEDGAYPITGDPYIDQFSARRSGASWALPTDAEWTKAGYYERQYRTIPGVGEVLSDEDWLYPTRSNSAPGIAVADSAGNISNPGNVANYRLGADWNGVDGNLTTVGSAGPLSASPYGTFDQAGNVGEWGEHRNGPDFGLYERQVLGGHFRTENQTNLRASYHRDHYDTWERDFIGFRVVQLTPVPEPSSILMAAAGMIGLLVTARRRKTAA